MTELRPRVCCLPFLGHSVYSKFHRNPFRGFGAPGSRNFYHFPLLWLLAFTTAVLPYKPWQKHAGSNGTASDLEQQSWPKNTPYRKTFSGRWRKHEI